MRVTFIPHCDQPEALATTTEYGSEEEGTEALQALIQRECDPGNGYLAVAQLRLAAYLAERAAWSAMPLAEQSATVESGLHATTEQLAAKDPLPLSCATDYGYVVVTHW